MAGEFAPRGWRAARAAEQKLKAARRRIQRAAAASAQHATGRSAAAQLAAAQQPPAKPALAETPLPWGARPDALQQCAAPAAAEAGHMAGVPPPQLWLAVAIVVLVAFAAGWLMGRWHLRRVIRSRQCVTSADAAASAAVATADAAPVATSVRHERPVAELNETPGLQQQPEQQAAAAAGSGTAAATGSAAGGVVATAHPADEPAESSGEAPLTPLPVSSSAKEVRFSC